AFQLQDLRLGNHYQATPETCLAVFLFRLAFPNHYNSCFNLKVFGHSISWIETAFNGTLIYIYEQRKEFLYWDTQQLMAQQLQTYCDTINTPGNRIYGFIDDTHQAICQPSTIDWKFFYSGYKKVYSVKFQAIVVPDRLTIHLTGCPYKGILGDWSIYSISQFGRDIWPMM
ncbi:hypothetical protein L873DRAFT_1701774, partial [Choiromyces venosus 120613-1]